MHILFIALITLFSQAAGIIGFLQRYDPIVAILLAENAVLTQIIQLLFSNDPYAQLMV